MMTPKPPKMGPALGAPAAPARSVSPLTVAPKSGLGTGFGGGLGQKPAGQAALARMQERRAVRQAARPVNPAVPGPRPRQGIPAGPGLRAGNPNYIPPVGMNPQGPMMANGGKAKPKPKSSGRKR